MSGPERWAPFPVQDWSTMPPPEFLDAAPAPSWGPPTGRPVRPRAWWLPLVVLLCVGLVVGTGTWLARRTSEPRTAALRFVPGDGDALRQRQRTTRENVETTTTVVTEAARFTGFNGLQSGDPALVGPVLRADYEDPRHSRLWRSTSTSVDDVGVGAQTVRYYRVRGAVELAGEQSADALYAYEPALVELPADVAGGDRWTGSGSAGAALDYVSSFRASAAEGGCLDVEGTVEYRAKGSQQSGRTSALTRRWCPGRGMVGASESHGDVRTVIDLAPTDVPAPRTTADEPVRWSDPRGWTPRTWATTTAELAGQPQPVLGTVQTDITPVSAASGLVVRAMAAPADLLATTPKTADSWTPVWRAHPGGSVLGLAAFGSVVLVTTSDRELVAYSDAGLRLWDRRLPEVAPNPPARVSDSDAVVVDLSGRVERFAVADGTVRWSHPVHADVARSPAVGSGLVVVADRGGTVTALDAETGAVRWDTDLDAVAVAVAGGQVLVVQDRALFALDAQTGSTRWLGHVEGELTALTEAFGRALVVCKQSSLLVDDTGRVTARMPGYLSVDVTQMHVAGWSADRLDVVDPGGTVVATWPTSSTNLVSSARPGLATPQGVYLFGWTNGWTFDSWTTGG